VRVSAGSGTCCLWCCRYHSCTPCGRLFHQWPMRRSRVASRWCRCARWIRCWWSVSPHRCCLRDGVSTITRMLYVIRLTICHTLPVEVALRSLQVDTDKFKVNLVLDVAHHDESRHHTLALACGHCGGDLAVPDVVGTHQQGADSIGCHCKQYRLIIVYHWRAAADPIDLRCISQIFCVCLHVVQRGELVIRALADGRGHARGEVE
jgi:hypothetical protein